MFQLNVNKHERTQIWHNVSGNEHRAFTATFYGGY